MICPRCHKFFRSLFADSLADTGNALRCCKCWREENDISRRDADAESASNA